MRSAYTGDGEQGRGLLYFFGGLCQVGATSVWLFFPPATWVLQTKAKSAKHIETRSTNTLNMPRMFPARYGVEYLDERLNCIEHLRGLRLDFPRKYPMDFVEHSWGALNVRWVRDIASTSDARRLHDKVDRPNYQKLQDSGMTSVTATGMTRFRRSDTFDMIFPTSHSVSKIARKFNDDKDLQDWRSYDSGTQRNHTRVDGLAPVIDSDAPCWPSGPLVS